MFPHSGSLCDCPGGLSGVGREILASAPPYSFNMCLSSVCQWHFLKSPVTDSFWCALGVGWKARELTLKDFPLPVGDGEGG